MDNIVYLKQKKKSSVPSNNSNSFLKEAKNFRIINMPITCGLVVINREKIPQCSNDK